MVKRHTILIVENDFVIGRDLEGILGHAGYEVGEIVGSVKAAERALEMGAFDAGLVDIGLDDGSGFQVGASLSRRLIPFVYLTGSSDSAMVRQAAVTQPMGYVLKPFTAPQVLAALLLALENRWGARGRKLESALQRIASEVVQLGLASMAASEFAVDVNPVAGLAELSAREWEVLRELLAHQRVASIARKLFISPATVRNHLKSIFAKVGVHSQQELLERIVRHPNRGLTPSDDQAVK